MDAAIVIGAIIGFFVGCLATVLFAVFVVDPAEERRWHRELIKRGHAEYNQTTGAWQWKERKDGE